MAEETRTLADLKQVLEGEEAPERSNPGSTGSAADRRLRARLRHRQAQGIGGTRLDPPRCRTGNGEWPGRRSLFPASDPPHVDRATFCRREPHEPV